METLKNPERTQNLSNPEHKRDQEPSPLPKLTEVEANPPFTFTFILYGSIKATSCPWRTSLETIISMVLLLVQ